MQESQAKHEIQPTQLRLTLLGIGGAFDADRGVANTAALLELSHAERVRYRYLIDCGHTTGRQLSRLGLCYDDIDAALLTHAHGDHMDGLELYGYRARFKCGDRRAGLIADSDVLARAWQSLGAKMGRLKTGPCASRRAEIGDYFNVQSPPAEGVELAGGQLHVRFVPVPHIPQDPACGLILRVAGGPVLRWSGDTTFAPDSELFRDLQPRRGDRIFHECCFDSPFDTTVHTHFEELAKLPERVRKAIVLIHHGRVTGSPELLEDMMLGQPLQRFTFRLAPDA